MSMYYETVVQSNPTG